MTESVSNPIVRLFQLYNLASIFIKQYWWHDYMQHYNTLDYGSLYNLCPTFMNCIFVRMKGLMNNQTCKFLSSYGNLGLCYYIHLVHYNANRNDIYGILIICVEGGSVQTNCTDKWLESCRITVIVVLWESSTLQ